MSMINVINSKCQCKTDLILVFSTFSLTFRLQVNKKKACTCVLVRTNPHNDLFVLLIHFNPKRAYRKPKKSIKQNRQPAVQLICRYESFFTHPNQWHNVACLRPPPPPPTENAPPCWHLPLFMPLPKIEQIR